MSIGILMSGLMILVSVCFDVVLNVVMVMVMVSLKLLLVVVKVSVVECVYDRLRVWVSSSELFYMMVKYMMSGRVMWVMFRGWLVMVLFCSVNRMMIVNSSLYNVYGLMCGRNFVL